MAQRSFIVSKKALEFDRGKWYASLVGSLTSIELRYTYDESMNDVGIADRVLTIRIGPFLINIAHSTGSAPK
ncbi:MAG: hypothetical protein HQ478_02255 [Chloroflexi bacterium]|nr:hypothetical protein [Chloroflexota bacterium]